MTTYVPITSVLLAPRYKITKGVTNAGRPGFTVPTVYILQDGRKIDSTMTTERKKNLLPSVTRENESAQRGELAACFNDEGFFGTRASVRIGL